MFLGVSNGNKDEKGVVSGRRCVIGLYGETLHLVQHDEESNFGRFFKRNINLVLGLTIDPRCYGIDRVRYGGNGSKL